MATSHPIKNLQWLPAAYRVISSAFKLLSSICPKPHFSKPHLSNYSISLQISFALATTCSILEANSLRFGMGSNPHSCPLRASLGRSLKCFLSRKEDALVFLAGKKMLWGLDGIGRILQPGAWWELSKHWLLFLPILHPSSCYIYGPCVTYLCPKYLPLCTAKPVLQSSTSIAPSLWRLTWIPPN